MGNPDYPGRLEVIYPDDKAVAQVDGEYLTDVNDGKVVREYDQGKHSFKVFVRKGLFDSTLKQDTTIEIYGGHIVRATIKNEKLVIIDVVPIPGQGREPPPPPQGQAKGPGPQTVTTTTKLGIDGMSMEFSTTQTMEGMPGDPGAPPAPASAKPANLKSKITFLSDAGQCEVYLDGKRVASLGISGMDSPAKATVFDLKPSTYKIKVTWFTDTWYDGKITVGSGEDIKIQVDEGVFDVISRD